ncbi:Protein T25B9.3 a [Aphelenchoides avenae]|nr:Protein T25B9.3 a [Aphelenchus avenae]
MTEENVSVQLKDPYYSDSCMNTHLPLPSFLAFFIQLRTFQLFSFDGLLPATWFAIRIEYRLIYVTPSGFTEYPTKQELIVRTKTDTLYGGYATVEDRIITLEEIVSDAYHLNVTVATVFALRPKLSTLIVPELRCDRGTVKPPAQRVTSRATVHFDVRKMFSKNAVRGPKCFQLCIFPFVRAEILENGQQTFRGREWCGSLEEAQQLFGTVSHEASSSTPMQHENASLLVTCLSSFKQTPHFMQDSSGTQAGLLRALSRPNQSFQKDSPELRDELPRASSRTTQLP